MIELDSYAVLGIAPVLSAPAQLLYLKAGRRYDIGAVLFVALGAFGSAAFGPLSSSEYPKAVSVLWLLGPACLAALALRLFALSRREPMAFTLISLAQMWATVPLITYGLQRRQEFSGIYMGQLLPATKVLGCAILLSLFVTVIMAGARLPLRLRAASDSPEEYDILLGSRTLLALKVDLPVACLYIATGVAFRLAHSNLSPANFGTESLWMLLSVAALPMFHWSLVLVGPLMCVLLRYCMATLLSPEVAVIYGYLLLVVILSIISVLEIKVTRVKRA